MWILIVSILIDQVTKFLVSNRKEAIPLIPNILSLEYVENRGAVFGMMQGGNFILAIISAILCVAISWYIYQSKKNSKAQTPKVYFAWYMILAGGIGNLIDRITRGYVVDFIATPFIATFNIADTLVILGVCFLFVHEIMDGIKKKSNKVEIENINSKEE